MPSFISNRGCSSRFLNPESLLVLFIAAGTITVYSIFAKRNTFLSFLPVGISYGLVPVGVWLAFDPAGLLKGTDWAILPLPAICFGLMICVTDWAFTPLEEFPENVRRGQIERCPYNACDLWNSLYCQICHILVS